MPEFVHRERDLDIARREIDIGIRNRRPDQPWLAGRRTRSIAFAPYAARADITGWIGATGDRAATPSAAWIEAHHGDRIVTRVNDAALALGLAQAGIGRLLLPTFAEPIAPGLVRVGDPVPDLATDEWLVSHHEGRHEPAVRAALDAPAHYLSAA